MRVGSEGLRGALAVTLAGLESAARTLTQDAELIMCLRDFRVRVAHPLKLCPRCKTTGPRSDTTACSCCEHICVEYFALWQSKHELIRRNLLSKDWERANWSQKYVVAIAGM